VFLVLPFLRRINRFLPVPAGAAGGPLMHFLFTGGGASASTLGILAVIGGVVGLFVTGIGSGSDDKHGHHGSGGGFWGGGGSSWSGGSGGGIDFGGGGGSFDGGGSSGDW
jgi:uncharacterized protein